MVFLLYYNVMVQYGIEKFFKRCQETGVDGLIIPDLPYEESDEINKLDYMRRNQYQEIVNITKDLIRIRKEHARFSGIV